LSALAHRSGFWSGIYANQGAASYAAYFVGDADITGCVLYNGGTLGTCVSDARVKKNITGFTPGLSQIIGLNPVTYEYNGLGSTVADGTIRTGLVAQQVQKTAPELVHTTSVTFKPTDAAPTSVLEVKYGDLVFAIINSVKELNAENAAPEKRIEKLEKAAAH
jgi:hypothetical protein